MANQTVLIRAKINAPEWFKLETNGFVPKTKPYWKITVVLTDLHHDGYCSGTEEEECVTTNYIVYRFVSELDTEVGFTWKFPLSCQHDDPDFSELTEQELDEFTYKSGYCEISSKACVTDISHII